MERLELNVTKRAVGKSASRKLRREGSVPAILYGSKREPVALFVNSRELDGVLNTEAGWNILLDLKVDGSDKILARISDYQADVLRRNLTHVDFQVLDLTKKIKAEVPIRLSGTPEGVKNGGVLELIKRTLEVKCLPTNIPEHLDIDVSALQIGDNVHVSNIVMPEGVENASDTNFSIAAIVAPTEEIVAEAPVAPVEGEAAATATPAEGDSTAAAGEKSADKAGEKGTEKSTEKAAKK